MSRVELRVEPDFLDCLRVAENLRESDRAELFATIFGDDPKTLATRAVASGGFRWGAYLDGEPVALIGAMPLWPRVWQAWAYGTDDWPKVALTLTRHVRNFMLPALLRSGAHRVQAASLGTHTSAHAWLKKLGARPECRLANYGKNGEDFVNFVWTRKTAKRAIRPRTPTSRAA